jgi:hypothetical protein
MGVFDFKCAGDARCKSCKNRDDQSLFETMCLVSFKVGAKEYTTAGIYSGYGWVDIYPEMPKQKMPHVYADWMEKGDGGYIGEASPPSLSPFPPISLHLNEFKEFFDCWGDVHHIADKAVCWECGDLAHFPLVQIKDAYMALAKLPDAQPNVESYAKKQGKKRPLEALAEVVIAEKAAQEASLAEKIAHVKAKLAKN